METAKLEVKCPFCAFAVVSKAGVTAQERDEAIAQMRSHVGTCEVMQDRAGYTAPKKPHATEQVHRGAR